MELTQVTNEVFQVTLPIVNVFLVDLPSGLLLIDAGPKGSKDQIFEAIRNIGKQPEDLHNIVLTHAHNDHSGGLAEILNEVDVPVFASEKCAEMVRKGIAFRSDSVIKRFLINLITFYGKFPLSFAYIEPIKKNINTVREGNRIPDSQGLQVIVAPGHTEEQIALFYPAKEAVLFAADVAENMKALKASYAYQSQKVNFQTLTKLAKLSFQKVVFGHGKPATHADFQKMAS